MDDRFVSWMMRAFGSSLWDVSVVFSFHGHEMSQTECHEIWLREYVSHNLGGVNIFIFSFYHHFGYHLFYITIIIFFIISKFLIIFFHFPCASAGAVGKPLSARPSEVLFAQGPISLGQMVPCYENRLCQS